MKSFTIAFAFVLGISVVGCSSYRYKSSDYMEINKGSIHQTSKIADYAVKTKKVKGFYSGIYKSNRHSYYIDLGKSIAMGEAIIQAKCDFLVHPLFDIKIDGKMIEVTVEGYPATYTSFKTIEVSELPEVEEDKGGLLENSLKKRK